MCNLYTMFVKFLEICKQFSKPAFAPFVKTRKRIESLFSQLSNQFLVIRDYAKDTSGLFVRIINKVSVMSRFQQTGKTVSLIQNVGIPSINSFMFGQPFIHPIVQYSLLNKIHYVEIKMKHRIFFPFRFQIFEN